MNNLTQSNPDSPDVRNYPLIPTLIFMTMTSLSPLNGTNISIGYGTGIVHSTTGPLMANPEGIFLFMKQELEMIARRNNAKKHGGGRSLAELKGSNLPAHIMCLPDAALEFLDTQDIIPDFINSTEEGSLIIEFKANSNYYLTEFFSDGDIVLLSKGSNGTDTWDLTSDSFLRKLKEELLAESQFELVE